MRVRRGFVASVAVLGAVVLVPSSALPGVDAAGTQRAAGPVAGPVAGCREFPADNWWNAPVTDLPVHRRSDQWMRHMSPGSDLHPDFGPSYGEQPVPYGIPVTVVGERHRRVPVRFRYAAESDRVRYPLGRDTRIEGGPGASGDRHALVVDRSRCRLYETFATRRADGRWRAGSGAVWDLGSNDLRPRGWTSADAAGLPILAGLLRLREVRRGTVDHAIRFTTDVTDRRHLWPARHDAGSVRNRRYPPMGARFRLRAGFSLAGYRQDTRVVLRAMQTYGLVLADNGSPWFFGGESVRGWRPAMLDELKTIPARAFEAVDTSALQVDPDSGETD